MNKQNENKIPDVEKEGWKAETIIREGANEESDEVVRKILRGDESKGDPEKRDIIGSPKLVNSTDEEVGNKKKSNSK